SSGGRRKKAAAGSVTPAGSPAHHVTSTATVLEPGGDKLPPAPYVPKTSVTVEEPAPSEITETEPVAAETTFVKPSVHAPKKAIGKFSLSSLKEKISTGNFKEENAEVAEAESDINPGQQKEVSLETLRAAWFAFAKRKNQEGKV